MANKTTTFTLNPNEIQSSVQSSAIITGRTVYGDVVQVTETITQQVYVPPQGSLSVTPDGETTSYQGGTLTFTVSWTNLKPETSILFTYAHSQTTPISITSNNYQSGSQTLTVSKPENNNSYTVTRVLYATGTTLDSSTITDEGYYIQGMRNGSISVTIGGEREVQATSGSGNYTVSWTYLKPGTTIAIYDTGLTDYAPISTSITTANYASGSVTIVGEWSANTGSVPRQLYIGASGTDLNGNTVSDSDYYEQLVPAEPMLKFNETQIIADNSSRGYGCKFYNLQMEFYTASTNNVNQAVSIGGVSGVTPTQISGNISTAVTHTDYPTPSKMPAYLFASIGYVMISDGESGRYPQTITVNLKNSSNGTETITLSIQSTSLGIYTYGSSGKTALGLWNKNQDTMYPDITFVLN